MTEQTVSVYQFSLADNTQEDEFLSVSAKSDTFLKKQKGFQYRSLSKIDDNSWLDIVYWSDLASAQQANAAFEKDEDCKRFMSMLNMDSIKMQKAYIVSQVMA